MKPQSPIPSRAGTIEVSLKGFITNIYNEVQEQLEYITEIEGIDIPKVWQDKILQPIDFAIQMTDYMNTDDPSKRKSGK